MGSSLLLPSSLTAGSSAPTNVVIGANSYPVPPTEIVERVKRIHPALNLRFADGIGGAGWSITWEWQEHDKRRDWIKTGRTDPNMAYDIVGYLPFGCSLDEAPAYIERSLKQYPREEVSRLAGRMQQWNHVERPKEMVSDATASTMDDYAREQRAPKGQLVSLPGGKVKSKRSA